uniref:Uncharacterized protein n=1 Tax=Arcella intermedia TaxID=1963864 RepID=A0A6B2LUM3_9EUKA
MIPCGWPSRSLLKGSPCLLCSYIWKKWNHKNLYLRCWSPLLY